MKKHYFLHFLLALLSSLTSVLNDMNRCTYKIFGYLGNKAMAQTYNDLLKHPLVNVSKELMLPEPVHPVHDELCQREIKVKYKSRQLYGNAL